MTIAAALETPAAAPASYSLRESVAIAWTERAAALGYKAGSKKADNAALEYVSGAYVAARAATNADLSVLVWLVSIRGAAELNQIAAQAIAARA